jgi:acetaldehyde dehydrogenase (acetylating)
MAGFEVPPETSIVCAEISGVGKQHPLSAEKLSPVLSLYFVKDFAAALDTCYALLKFGGMGHTAVIHAKDEARIREFAARMPAMRVLVNTPSPQGSTGITTNVFPSMTLGCGAVAGNITSDNVGPLHLINVKRLAYVTRKAEEAFETPLDYRAGVPAAQPAPLDRPTVAAAVERYLASRGIAVEKTPPPANRRSEVVGQACPEGAPPAKPGAGPSCCAVPPAADFVCEADVRAAIEEKRKIPIGPGTIVTPSARDLAAEAGVLTPLKG